MLKVGISWGKLCNNLTNLVEMHNFSVCALKYESFAQGKNIFCMVKRRRDPDINNLGIK